MIRTAYVSPMFPNNKAPVVLRTVVIDHRKHSSHKEVRYTS